MNTHYTGVNKPLCLHVIQWNGSLLTYFKTSAMVDGIRQNLQTFKNQVFYEYIQLYGKNNQTSIWKGA